MATYKKMGYFYIGLFTLAGLFLLVSALIILGSKTAYKNAIFMETYFNESVQGLTVGSPVKYRGMEIGKIIDIASINSVYDIPPSEQAIVGNYIYVKMAIKPRQFQSLSSENIKARIDKEIANGLRIKISVQGLTGNAYLELDYSKTNPASFLPIKWIPENYYIPSTPSTLTFFSDSAQQLLDEVKKIEFKKLFDSVQQLSTTTKQTLTDADKLIIIYNHQIMEILMNLQTITQNMKAVSERAKTYPSSILFSNPPTKLDPNRL